MIIDCNNIMWYLSKYEYLTIGDYSTSLRTTCTLIPSKEPKNRPHPASGILDHSDITPGTCRFDLEHLLDKLEHLLDKSLINSTP